MSIGRARHVHVDNAVIHLHIAKVLIMLGFAGRQLHRAQGDIGGVGFERKAVLVQVVTVGRHKTQLDVRGRAFDQVELERLADRQKIAAVIHGAQRSAGAVVQQSRAHGGHGDE